LTVEENSNKVVLAKFPSPDGVERQSWKRELQDEVGRWFTLYNKETEMYLTAETGDETITKSKSYCACS